MVQSVDGAWMWRDGIVRCRARRLDDENRSCWSCAKTSNCSAYNTSRPRPVYANVTRRRSTNSPTRSSSSASTATSASTFHTHTHTADSSPRPDHCTAITLDELKKTFFVEDTARFLRRTATEYHNRSRVERQNIVAIEHSTSRIVWPHQSEIPPERPRARRISP